MKWLNVLVLVVFLSSLAYAAEDNIVMYIQLGISGEKMSVEDVGLVEGESSNVFVDAPEYTAIVSSLQGEKSEADVSFPGYVYADSFDPDEEPISEAMIVDNSAQILFFPYYRDVDKLVVYDSERKLVLSYDLSEYRICDFDGSCKDNEDFNTCPEDCKEEDVEEVAKEIKEKKEELSEDEKVVGGRTLLIIVAIFVVLGLIFGLILKRKRKIYK